MEKENKRVADAYASIISVFSDVVFGVTGACVVNLIDGLHKQKVPFMPMHHEQSAAMAADAYARTSNKLGVCIGTSGPGATNLITGTCCSWFDSVPVLTITGQVPTNKIRRKERQKTFQETDSVQLFKPITNYSHRVNYMPEYDLCYAIDKARKYRKGPVHLDLPEDIQREEAKYKFKYEFNLKTPSPKKRHINKVVRMLNKANRPVIIIGAGCSREVVDYLYKLNIPVILSWGAKDYMDSTDYLNMGDIGLTASRAMNIALERVDLVIAVGTRLDNHMVPNHKKFAPNAKKIFVNIDKKDKKPCDLFVKSDGLKFVKALTEKFIFLKEDWILKLKKLKDKYPIYQEKFSEEKLSPYTLFNELTNMTPCNYNIVVDMGQTGCWALQSWKVKKGQRLLSAFNHSPMGYSIPGSIGAALGNKQLTMAIVGDGSLMMNLQDLQTIAGLDLPIKIILLDNQGYGMIRQTQSSWESLSKNVACVPESGLTFPDWKKLGKVLGFRVIEVSDKKHIKKIKPCLMDMTPTIVVVKINQKHIIEPKMKFGGEVINQEPKISEKEIVEVLNKL